jgi:O-antigen/teichoic acid export membrane protein
VSPDPPQPAGATGVVALDEPTVDAPPPARRRLAIGASAALAGQLATVAGGVVTSIFLAHWFGPSGTGTYALLGNLFAAVILLSALGLPTGITFFVSRRHWPLRAALHQSAAAALCMGAVGGALGYLFYALTRDSVWKGVTPAEAIVVMAAVPFGLAWTLAGAAAIAVDLYERFASFQISRAVLTAACTAGLGLAFGLSGAIVGFALAQPLAAVLAMTSMERFARRDPHAPPGEPRTPGGRSVLRRAFDFGRKAWSADVLQFINYRLDLFILGAFVSRADVGRYALAVSLTMVGWLLPSAIGQVLFPRTASLDSAAAGDAGREAADDAAARVIRHTVILQLPTALALAILLVLGIPLAYGEAFAPSIGLGFVLLPGVLAVSIAKVVIAVVTGRGYPQYSLYTTFVTVPVTIALYAVLIPLSGAIGAAVGSTVSYVLSTVLALYFYGRVTGRPIRAALVPTAADLREYPAALSAALARVRARHEVSGA